MKIPLVTGLVVCAFVAAQYGFAQNDETEKPNGIPGGIVWYGVLNDGIAEAKARNRPILLLSAAPQCAGVPGMW